MPHRRAASANGWRSMKATRSSTCHGQCALTWDQDVQGAKEVEVFQKQKDRVLKAFKEQAEEAAPTGSGLALRKLLVRRAIAMNVAGIAYYEALDEWSEQLFEAMEEEAPPGYAPVSAEPV
eukprot:TRINITY_DN89308_c0_g1_i1.p1 TRINITY_DN89308_c0_g1~~TRINITY_DN89308_c0_g1_i1.p1  ORF type:complete len:121 (-),score=28.58 TRINITY_DN89308_c0_g1_i1:142-504(-)